MARVFGASAALALVASCAPPLPWSGYQLYTVSSPSADDWPRVMAGLMSGSRRHAGRAFVPRIYTLPDKHRWHARQTPANSQSGQPVA